MKKLLIPGLMLALASTALTSCMDDEDNKTTNTVTRSYTECFNTVYDSATGEITYNTNPSYTINITTVSDGTATVAVSMSGVRFGDLAGTFDLPAVDFKMSTTGFSTASATDLRPVSNVQPVPVTFDTFSFGLLDRYIRNEATAQTEIVPAYTISFMVNGRYTVTVYPTRSLYFAKTTSTADADGSEFTSTNPRYTVTLNPATLKGSISIAGAQFLANMPAMNMDFTDIPFTAGINTLELAAESLVPSIAGTPYPSFPISNLELDLKAADSTGELEFDCDASRMGKYHVTAPLSLLPEN